MNFLFDIGHPAQGHLFKHVIRGLEQRGHRAVVYARRKDCLPELLEAEGFRVVGWTRAGRSSLAKIAELAMRDAQVLYLVRRYAIDVAVGTSVAIVHAGRLTGIPAYVFNENDVDTVLPFAFLAYPFCTGIVAPANVQMGRWASKHIKYNGYQKLAYLHPAWFKRKEEVLSRYGLDRARPYALVRTAEFKAYHDRGHAGISADQLRRLVSTLGNFGKVFLSSEGAVPSGLEDCQLTLQPEHMHDVMAYASVLVGDSQSMAIESAMLGVPAFYFGSFARRFSVSNELETEYGLMFSYGLSSFEEMLNHICEVLTDERREEIWEERKREMLSNKVDVTRWIIEFLESPQGRVP